MIGRAPLPPGRRVSFVEMSSTQEDGQRVEVEGIVHKVFKKGNRLYLEVATADGHVIGRLPFYKREAPTALVDARVRIRGTCGAQFASANQITGVYINIPYESEIEILQPALADPFNVPTRAISDLLRFSLAGNLGHRVKVHGVVTLYRPGKGIFVQNESGSAFAQTQQTTSDIAAGDEVDLVGFATVGPYQPELHNAIFRRTGAGAIPKPLILSAAGALHGHFVPLVTRHSLHEEKPSFRILLAEDNAVNQVLAVRLLEKRGYSIVVAANGRAAVQAFETQLFHLVLMDIQMPGMDGFEATAAIRQAEKITGKHIPIVAMTAHALKGDQDRCMAVGMDGYVS